MSSSPTVTFPESLVQQREHLPLTTLRFRGVSGNEISLHETKHNNSGGGGDADRNNSGAIKYVLRDVSRWRFSGTDLGLLCLTLAFWTATGSLICIALGVVILAVAFKNAVFTDRTNTLLLVESVGVHIINQKTIFGAFEEYLPWNSINDVFINEIISEQKVLYYLTFIIKELTSNGEERIKLIPLFQDLKP